MKTLTKECSCGTKIRKSKKKCDECEQYEEQFAGIEQVMYCVRCQALDEYDCICDYINEEE